MHRLSLYDFYDMFRGARRFAVVGNAGTILNYDNGALIDSHDVVVRFNCAYTSGIESKVGSRTDILCANIGRNLDNCPAPATTVRPRCVVNFADRSPRDGDCEPDRFEEWVGDLPGLITWAPDLIGFTQGRRSRQFTQGTYMIYTLLRLFEVEELFLTGFTMYQPVAGSTMKYFGEQKLGVGLGHDLDSEEKTFKALIATFTGKLETTPEVARLLAQSTDGPAIRRGFLGAADADARVRWHEHLRAWLSWACIRIGLGLRRGLETNSAFEFSAWQEGRRPRPTRRHKKRQAKSSGKSSTEQ